MPLFLDPETKPLDLHGRLAKLRRSSRGVIVMAGGMGLTALAIAIVTLAAIIDYRIHLPAPMRASILASSIFGIAMLARRSIVVPWHAAGNELAQALKVERHVPGLHDALASATQFSPQDVTSPQLRDATVHYAVDRTRGLDFTDIVDHQPVTRIGIALIAAIAAMMLLTPQGLSTAMARIFDPYGNHPWPTKTQLSVTAVDFIARGEPFELKAKLGGSWPDRLNLALSLDQAATTEQAYPLSAESSDVAIRLEPARIPRSFRYRLTAGDADTGWRTVTVTVPPELVPLDGRATPLVRLTFPNYTDMPPSELPDGTGSIEAVFGSRVQLRAAADRVINQATLRWHPVQPQAMASIVALAFAGPPATKTLCEIPVIQAVTAPMAFSHATDRRQFSLEFIPLVSGSYEMFFVDTGGLGGRRRFDVRVLTDPPPSVMMEQPYVGGEGMELMSGASFELKALVDDPMFAVRRVHLEYRTQAIQVPGAIPLYDGDLLAAALPELLTWDTKVRHRLRPRHITIDRRISLSSLHRADGKSLAIGDVLTLAVIAEDFDDVSPGKPPGRSHEVEIKIIGRERFEARVAQSRTELARALSELHKLQADALDQAAIAEQKRRATGQLTVDERGRLSKAESLQQQVRERLGNDREGLVASAERLRQTVVDNPGASPAIRGQAERLSSELARLARDIVEPIAPLIATARQETEAVPATERSAGALPEAVQRQRDAERSMRDMLEQLQTGQAVAALAADAAAISSEQQQLSRQRTELAAQLPPGADTKSLPEADQKALKQLQERQEQLARRTEVFQRQVESQAAATAKAAEDEQLRSRTLDDAIGDTRDPRKAGELRRESEKAAEKAESLRQETDSLNQARDMMRAKENEPSLPEQMNRAADALSRNRLGEAQQRQEAASDRLAKVREALRDSEMPEGERIVKDRLRSEKQVEKLIKDQESLQDRTLAAEKLTDQLAKKKQLEELAREEEQLAERSADMAKQLRREGQTAAAREMERAAGNMDRAKSQMERGQAAAAEQDDALERLDDAAGQTRRDRKEAEERLQREKMLKLADRIKGFADRQGNLSAETSRLYDAAQQANGWSRSMQKSLADLARAEESLGKELDDASQKHLQNFKVLQRLVEQAAANMADASAAIDDARASGLTKENMSTDRQAIRSAQDQATRQIALLLEVLQAPKEEMASAKPRPGADDPPPTSGKNPPAEDKPEEEVIPAIAQLKVLRQLQADLNERTALFDRLHPDPAKWTVAQKNAIDKLRRTQIDLAELFLEIAPESPNVGEKP